mmetsp:Transcript_70216/g.154837  ORF Transcript_70216/g.154837 Transcript_70216/m.154837 type:complete len:238 (-) Transcript_70216:232-945(-)
MSITSSTEHEEVRKVFSFNARVLSAPENAQVVLGDCDVQHICSHLLFQHRNHPIRIGPATDCQINPGYEDGDERAKDVSQPGSFCTFKPSLAKVLDPMVLDPRSFVASPTVRRKIHGDKGGHVVIDLFEMFFCILRIAGFLLWRCQAYTRQSLLDRVQGGQGDWILHRLSFRGSCCGRSWRRGRGKGLLPVLKLFQLFIQLHSVRSPSFPLGAQKERENAQAKDTQAAQSELAACRN